MGEMGWREPQYCPLCGMEAEKPDGMDPELIECEEHGKLNVSVIENGK